MPFYPFLGIPSRPGRRAVAASALLAITACQSAHALPSGWQVESGDVSFHVVNGDTLNVVSQSPQAIVNWAQFNIAAGETVNFLTPNNLASVFNRILGGASAINGALNSNGTVILSNPAGIHFGSEAQVNVGSLIASTLRLSSADYLAHRWTFSQPDGVAPSLIDNRGDITTQPGGFVVLSAGAIRNSGNIYAPEGRIALAVGDVVRLQMTAAQSVEVSVDAALKQRIDGLQAALENSGTLSARDIRLKAKLVEALYAQTVRHTGLVSATTAQVGETGHISLRAEGADASIVVSQSGKLLANASETGNGGVITLLADGHTQFDGEAQAKGGSQSGDGGFIETSGSQTLRIGQTARVDASAAQGEGGLWLMDPTNMTVHAGAGANDASNVYAGNIQTTLNTGTSVTVETASAGGDAGQITVLQDVSIQKTAGGDATLTLKAHDSIALAGVSGHGIDIRSTSGKLNVVLNADADQGADAGAGGSIQIGYTTIDSNGGNITLGGGADPASQPTKGTLTEDKGVWIVGGSTLSAGAGNISIRGEGRSRPGFSTLSGIHIEESSRIETTSGDITLNGFGGAGFSNNFGVLLDNAQIQTQHGAISIEGHAGDSVNNANRGVNIYNLSVISASGSGSVTIAGFGGAGMDYNQGLAIWTNSRVTTTSGALSLSGTASAATLGNGNVGVTLEGGSEVSTTGGALTLTGRAGAGGMNNHGFYLLNSSIIATQQGDITMIASSVDPDGGGVFTAGAMNIIGSNVMTGDLTIRSDASSLNNGLIRNNGGVITFSPYTSGASVGLNGGAGAVQIDNATFSRIDTSVVSPAQVTLGDVSAGTGLVTIANHYNLSAYDFDVRVAGGQIITGDVNVGANALTLLARTGDITLGGELTASQLTLNATGNLIDGNGATNNLTISGNASLTTSGAIGQLTDPLEIAVGGTLTLRPSGKVDGYNAVVNGSAGSLDTLTPTPAPSLAAAYYYEGLKSLAHPIAVVENSILYNGVGVSGGSATAPPDVSFLLRDKLTPLFDGLSTDFSSTLPEANQSQWGPVIEIEGLALNPGPY